MSYQATVYRVLIASPSDVPDERQIIPEVIHGWNDLHSVDMAVVLLPVGAVAHVVAATLVYFGVLVLTGSIPDELTRAAMEAEAQLWWLLEPGIGARRRVARFWLARASGARYLDDAVRKTDPAAPHGAYGETPAMVRAAVDGLGLSFSERQYRSGKWSWSCEGETLPGYTRACQGIRDGGQHVRRVLDLLRGGSRRMARGHRGLPPGSPPRRRHHHVEPA